LQLGARSAVAFPAAPPLPAVPLLGTVPPLPAIPPLAPAPPLAAAPVVPAKASDPPLPVGAPPMPAPASFPPPPDGAPPVSAPASAAALPLWPALAEEDRSDLSSSPAISPHAEDQSATPSTNDRRRASGPEPLSTSRAEDIRSRKLDPRAPASLAQLPSGAPCGRTARPSARAGPPPGPSAPPEPGTACGATAP
jgi:hypothetical protein